MAQPWAAAEGAKDTSSNERQRAANTANRIVRPLFIYISNRKMARLPTRYESGTSAAEAAEPHSFHVVVKATTHKDSLTLVRSQVHQPDAIREEHDQHHANAEYHGWDEEEKQAQAFEAQVHEVGHDQSRFDQREADQNRNHQVNFKAFVGEKHFDGGQQQQPDPNDREKSRGAYRMLVRKFGVPVRAHYEVLSLLLRIHAQQINHGENKHPDQVNEMPIKAAHFHVLGCVLPFSKAPSDDREIG